MAYKDEYEVARLYPTASFRQQLEGEFDGDMRLNSTSRRRCSRRATADRPAAQAQFGGWMLPVFRALAKLKFLRGTAFDLFGYTRERKTERKLIADYRRCWTKSCRELTPENHELAAGLAAIPEKIRGYGHVKARHLVAAKADEAALLEQFRAAAPPLLKAAE